MPATTFSIEIERCKQSRIHEVDFEHLVFGKEMSDHMLVADFKDGTWQSIRIVPYQPLVLNPAVSGLHYGQAIFEGMKAYRLQNGKIAIFRIKDHWERMNLSARRLCMAEIPEEIFVEGMKQLVALDKAWVPKQEGSALYIRPLMFATDIYIGMKPSDSYRFIIFTCPAPPYYSGAVHTKVITQYVRACPLGVGYIKMAGNYAPTLLIAKQIRAEGFHVALWLDAKERKYIEEFSTMNAFFRIDDTVITPPASKTILNGVTRRSVIQLLKDEGIKVEERPISIDEIIEAHKKGRLREAFGTGTAASVSPVARIHYEGIDIYLPEEQEYIPMLREKLDAIRYGKVSDPYGWLTIVDA